MVILDNLLGVVNSFNAGSGKVLWQQNGLVTPRLDHRSFDQALGG